MADIDDRWHRVDKATGRRVRTGRYGAGKRWDVRWRDDGGRQRHKAFDRKVDAERFLAGVATDLARGVYVDPNAGRVTLRKYAEEWLAAQTFDESTRQATELRLRLHVFPDLGNREVRMLGQRPSLVQAWVRGLQQELAGNYVRVIFANLSAVLSAAVDDGLIARNPCRVGSVKPPPPSRRMVNPWPTATVAGVRAVLPARYAVCVDLAAGLGLRQGETFGLAVEDVDFLRGVVHIRRQVKILSARLAFASPKGGKSRDVPLPESVALRLAQHLAAFEARVVTLLWHPTGQPVTVRLVLTSRESGAMNRNYFNTRLWKPALMAAGVPPTRDNGMHALRHHFASVLLEDGVSIKAVSEYLGHADPGFTLRTYTHLMPASDDRMRKAVDRALSLSAVDGQGEVRRMCATPMGSQCLRRSAAHDSRCRSTARTREGEDAAGSGRSRLCA
jgi:integrase